MKLKTLTRKIGLLAITSCFVLSCSDDSPDPVVDQPEESFSVSLLSLSDVANNNNASDFKVSFEQKNDLSQIAEYRIFILKSENIGAFDLSTAESISSDRYIKLDADQTTYQLYLENQLKTPQGETVTNGQNYSIFVLSVTNSTKEFNSLSTPSNSVKLSNSLYVETLDIPGFKSTDGISIDKLGNIYTSVLGPQGNGVFTGTQILKYDLGSGELSVFSDAFNGPLGHAFDNEGNLFVSNINGETISKVDASGNATTFIADSQLTGGDIVFAEDGTMYHSVYESGDILKIDAQKNITTVTSGELLDSPLGLVLLENDDLIVANFSSGKIVRVSPTGEQSLLASLPTAVGYICRIDDTIYATGWSSNKVYAVKLSGEVTELMGTASGGTIDGDINTASFVNPNGIEASADGKYLYLTQSTQRLRRIALVQ